MRGKILIYKWRMTVKKSQRTGKEESLSLVHRLATYKAIKELSSSKEYPVDKLCKYLSITRLAYYHWLKHPKSNNELQNEMLSIKIQKIHTEHSDMGYRRIRDELDGTREFL